MTTAATSRPPATAGKVEAGKPKRKRSRKKLILIAIVVLLLGVAGYVGQAMLFGGEPPKAAPDPKTVAGKVLPLDPITMNLADGHYLKLTFVLQLSKAASPAAGSADSANSADSAGTATPALNNAAALDASIDVLGEHTYAQLIAPGGRARAQKELLTEIQKRYPGEVLGLYFTEFLMQ